MQNYKSDIVLKLYQEGYSVIPSGGGKTGKSPIVPCKISSSHGRYRPGANLAIINELNHMLQLY